MVIFKTGALQTCSICRAVEWNKQGMLVSIIKNDVPAGFLSFAGTVKDNRGIPEDAEVGITFFVRRTMDFCVCGI